MHVFGDSSVMPTTKPGQVDPVLAWEVLFAFSVFEGGGVPSRVLGVYFSTNCGVYVGAVGGVIRERGKGV